MLKRPHYIGLCLVVLLVLVLLNLPAQTSAQIKLALGGLFLPLFGLSQSAETLVVKAGDQIVPRKTLLQENERLREENRHLQIRRVQSEEAARENDRLRQALGWQKQASWKTKLAQVIGRDTANWWRSIHINLGSRDGLRENLPVVTQEGLVGRITSVSLTRAQVTLVGNPDCRVAALIQESRANGVIVPAAPGLDPGTATLTYLSGSSRPAAGQQVVTSGLGGIFPKGLTVGVITEAHPGADGLHTEARVRLTANLNRLEEVWVLFP